MSYEPDYVVDQRKKYAYWSRSAPLMLPVLLAVVGASAYFHTPNWLFLVTNAGGGVAMFFAWRLTISQGVQHALPMVVLALGLCLTAIWVEHGASLPLLFAQGIGTVGAAQSLCFLLARYAKQG